MPNKEVQKVKIPGSLKFVMALIGKDLLKIRLNKNNLIIANQNAENDEFNRIFQGCILYGTFLVVLFKLVKHQKKITKYKEEFLEEYYYRQRKMKEKNRKHNKEVIFKNAA